MKTFKQFLNESKQEKYSVLNDFDSKGKKYWYVVNEEGDPLYDDDGNDIHFKSFNDAKKYIIDELDGKLVS